MINKIVDIYNFLIFFLMNIYQIKIKNINKYLIQLSINHINFKKNYIKN